MANRLANETSPYLLQHKDNPVDWYPWGDEAFEKARREGKAVLLSVGYSACHWCHVMEHESFENAAIAGLMNELFVSVKVDREERPDVDSIYMQAVQAMTGRGGWPMTVFLTPDGRPFYGGTYYPPEDGHGLPGFPRLLRTIAEAYGGRRAEIEGHAERIGASLGALAELRPGDDPIEAGLLDQAFAEIETSFDPINGGFGTAPKFPQPMALDFLLRYHHRTGRPEALAMVEKALRKMAQGGIYDQVGGGFHRYAVDAVWLVPHFEKMLYDNAQLARLYLDAFRLSGDPFYRRICEETLDYVLREMTDPTGAFYSTQDADSEGEEGKFYIWGATELDEALGVDAALLKDLWGVTPLGNFEGKNILNLPAALPEFAATRGIDPEDLRVRVERARAALYTKRERRVHPARDEKVLTAWNGMMLRAFAEAARVLASPIYRDAAVRNAEFLLATLHRDGRLLRSWRAGEAKLKAYLEDYALLIDGLLATYEATFESRYLATSLTLTDEMIRLFWDDAAEGFFDTGSDHESLITRPREVLDNATPSGTSAAADVLLRLAVLTGKPDLRRRAEASLRTLVPFLERAPVGLGRLLGAVDFYLARPSELAVVWEGNPAAAQPLLDVAFAAYRPHLVVAGGLAGAASDLTPLLRDRPTIDGRPTAYVCEQFVCQAPTTDPEELRRQLDAAGR
jgi:uncharacterized protein YyaL (SSP411 family)